MSTACEATTARWNSIRLSPNERYAAVSATPVDHHPKRPAVWRARFKAHIDSGVQFAKLVGDELATAREFSSDLEDAGHDFRASQDLDRERQFLLRIKAIAEQALSFYEELKIERLRMPIESLRFDLDGLNEVLARDR